VPAAAAAKGEVGAKARHASNLRV